MNNFDDIIRAKAKMEPIILPKGYEEHNDNLIKELNARHFCSSKKNIEFPIIHFKSPAIAVLIVLLLTCVSAAAYTLSGGDFFKQYFSDKANNDTENDYSYMNTEQLNDMASSTVGTVVDTNELTIDVMGVIVSGNTAEIMLRVTANQLNSVLYETGIEPLENYRFNDDMSGSLFDDFEMGSIGYYYSDKDESLAPNQFEILYTLIGKEAFEKGQYTIELENFGYFDFSKEDQFVPLYDGSWQFYIAFDPNTDTSKNIFINKEITVGDYGFTLNSVNVTPLACTISLKCNENDVYLNENLNKIFKAFSDGSEDCSLTFTDGTILNSDQFEVNPSGGEEGFMVILTFNAPITVDDAVSLSLFGTVYSLE